MGKPRGAYGDLWAFPRSTAHWPGQGGEALAALFDGRRETDNFIAYALGIPDGPRAQKVIVNGKFWPSEVGVPDRGSG